MSLRAVIEQVRGREKTLSVYTGPDSDIVGDLQDHFAAENLHIESRPADGVPEHAVLSDDGEFLTAVRMDALRSLTDGPRDIGEEVAYSDLLDHLDRATFASHSRAQMLEASREIEDRAWRADGGTLHAGFQTLSNFDPQRETYRRLAEGDVDVHVYARECESAGVPDGVQFHTNPDVATWWFVIFDGDDHRQSTALLAEERPDDQFYGVWTYDPPLVEQALDAIDATRMSA